MISVENISIGHGHRTLASGISFHIHPGECILLAGPNGCGKTTLLRTLAGPSAHMVPTGIPKVKGFTVSDFIRTGCYRESNWKGRLSPSTEKRLLEALDLLGITSLAERDISTLSDGEFQKACIATALIQKAELLLMDEPTAFLDAGNRVHVLQTLRKVARTTGTAVLFSSHDLADALHVADRVFAFTPAGLSISTEENREEILAEAFPEL